MLKKEECLKVLEIDDKVRQCQEHIQLFKKDILLLYVGKCRRAKIIVTSKGEEWVGKVDIFYRQFGCIMDFILGSEKIHFQPKIGDIAYVDPHLGEFLPIEHEDEMFYFKTIKLDEINLLIK